MRPSVYSGPRDTRFGRHKDGKKAHRATKLGSQFATASVRALTLEPTTRPSPRAHA